MPNFISTYLVAFLFATACIAEPHTGVRTLAAGSEDDPQRLSLSVWYPAEDGGSLEDVGGNAVFVGQPAYRNATVAPGSYPLVLLSHGGLRSAADSGAWLSGRLAEEGFVVVEVNGPRPDNAADAVHEIWRRPQDVSHALDRILQDPAWSTVVDPARIAVVGHALGGTAALALTGGRLDADAFASACAAGADGPDCAWYAAQGVSLADVDRRAGIISVSRAIWNGAHRARARLDRKRKVKHGNISNGAGSHSPRLIRQRPTRRPLPRRGDSGRSR